MTSETGRKTKLAAATSLLRENHRAVQQLLCALARLDEHGDRRKQLYAELADLAAIEAKVFYPVARHALM